MRKISSWLKPNAKAAGGEALVFVRQTHVVLTPPNDCVPAHRYTCFCIRLHPTISKKATDGWLRTFSPVSERCRLAWTYS